METVIETKGLTKQYGKTTALNQLDLTLKKGDVLGYLGPNGAGKTTTIRLLLGLIKPTAGSATILGHDAWHHAARLHTHIAYVPGETTLWPHMTGAETLRFLANIHGSYDDTYQTELIHKFQFDPDKKVRSYSKGNRQKIMLIAALATRAELLLFDEPTSGLDPVMAKVFRDEIRAAHTNGQTVFLSSHILEEIEDLCNKVAILREGTLIEYGSLQRLQHLSAVIVEATFASRPPDVSHIKNLSNVTMTDNQLRCHVSGSIDELLQVVSKAHPISFLSRKPSLEELFFTFYNGETQ